MAPAVRTSVAILWLALLASLPWIPVVSLLPFVPMTLMWAALEMVPPRARHTGLIVLATVASTMLSGTGVLLMHGQRSAAITVMFVGITAAGTGFPDRIMIPLALLHTSIVVAIIACFSSASLTVPPQVMLVIAAFAGVVIMMLAGRRVTSDLRSALVLDPLTGLLNRSALDSRSHELSELSERDGAPVALVVADIDHFKAINDTHGHAAGDAVLVEIASRLREHSRGFDHVYRLGGEEFAILIPGATATRATVAAERLRESIADRPLVGDVRVTASFGVSGSEEGTRFRFAEQFALADAALYRAKQAGRNRVVLDGELLPADRTVDAAVAARA